MKSFVSLQTTIALLLALVVCFGFIIPFMGFAYYSGYLSAFGLDGGRFPVSLPDLWRHSLYAAADFAGALPGYGQMLALAALVALAGFIFWYSLNLLNGVNPVIRFFKGWRFPVLLCSAPSFFILAAMPSTAIMLSGQAKAMRHIAEYRALGCLAMDCVSYSNPGDPGARNYSGLLAATSATHIAILDQGGLSVIERAPEFVLTRQSIIKTRR